jgi:hypothetical protein
VKVSAIETLEQEGRPQTENESRSPMTEGPNERDPPRLRDEPGNVGRALRSADSSFDKDLVEGAAWRKLDRRRRRRVAIRWALAAGAMGIAIGALGLRSRWAA